MKKSPKQAVKKAAKRGRKPLPEGQKRTETVSVKVTKAERERIEELAAHRGLSLTEWLRLRGLGQL